MSSFSVVERLLFIARRADASFSACVGSKKEQKQKSAGVLYDELRHFLCYCMYLSV